MAQISYGTFTITDVTDIKEIKNWYLASAQSSGVTRQTPGWTDDIQEIDSSKPYLWNYEQTIGAEGIVINETDPVIIATHGGGAAGKGMKRIDEYYKASNDDTQPPSTWNPVNVIDKPTSENRYLWNYQVIVYTDDSTEGSAAEARIIGVYGDKGDKGDTGVQGEPGVSRATVYIYKRANSVTQPANSTYYFETGNFNVPTGWSSAIPENPSSQSGGITHLPCWVCSAVATGSGESAPLEWGSATVLVKDGESATNVQELYYLKTNSSAVPSPDSAPIYDGTDRKNAWSSAIPAYDNSGGTYYICMKTTFADGNIVYTTPVINQGLTDANSNATSALDIAQGIHQNFWVEATGSSGVPAGVYITQKSESAFKTNQTGANIFMQAADSSNGIRIRDGSKVLAALMDSGIQLYVPNPQAQGRLGLSLDSTNGLRLYNQDSQNNVAAQLGSNGLHIKNGSITLGDAATSTSSITNGSIALTNSTFERVIDNTNRTLQMAIGSKFGVGADGTLYAANADISGKITVGSGSNVYTTDNVNPLEVGGRNLLLDSESMASWYAGSKSTISGGIVTITGSSADWNAYINTEKYDASLYNGDNYIFSFEYNSTVACDVLIVIAGSAKQLSEHSWARSKYGYWRSSFMLPSSSGKWVKHTMSARNISLSDLNVGSGDVVSGYLQIYNRTDNGVLKVKHLKFEKGNKATDWTPAPEDIEISFSEQMTNMLLDTDVPSEKKVKAQYDRYFSDSAGSTYVTCSIVPISDPPEPGIKYAYKAIGDGKNTSNIARALAFYSATNTTAIPFKVGTEYTVTYWGRCTSGSAKTLANYRYTGTSNRSAVAADLTSEWKLYTGVIKLDSMPTDYNRIWFYIQYNAGIAGTAELCGFKIVPGNYNKAYTFRGTLGTGWEEADKTVVCSGFDSSHLVDGTSIVVTASSSNNYDGTITLNVNETGAKQVYVGNTVTSITNQLRWLYGSIMRFSYKGGVWYLSDSPGSYYSEGCDTLEGTGDKVAVFDDLVIRKGTSVTVPMTNSNTSTAPRLAPKKVNTTLHTADHPMCNIYFGKSNTVPTKANSYAWPAGAAVIFTFDGQYWRFGNQTFINGGNILTGSVAADRIKANVVSAINLTSDKIDAKNINAGQITVGSLADGANYPTTTQMNTAIGTASSEAAKTATSYISKIDNNGIYISPSSQNPSAGSEGNSIKLDGNGMNIYKGGTAIAKYGGSITIGPDNKSHLSITDTSVRFYDSTGANNTAQVTSNGLYIMDPESNYQRQVAYFGSHVSLYKPGTTDRMVYISHDLVRFGGFDMVAVTNGNDYLVSDYTTNNIDYRTWIRSAQGTDEGDTWAFSVQTKNSSETDYVGNWLVKSNGKMRGVVEAISSNATTTKGTYVSSSCTRFGQVVQLLFTCKNGSSIAAGQNVYEGTLSSAVPAPKQTVMGICYYGDHCLIGSINTSKQIIIRNASSSAVTLSSNANCSFVYITNDHGNI